MAGVEVSGKDGRTLVGLLLRIGRDTDLALALRVERSYSRQVGIISLSPAERDLLLNILDDPTDGLLELRGVLARDHQDRNA